MKKTKLLCLICLLCLLFTSCSAPNIDWSTWEPTKQTTKAPDSTTAPPEEGGQDIPATSATYVLTKGELVDGAAVGNTIVLTDSAKAALQSIVANGATDQTKITACGKNILKIPESLTTRTRNNVNFAFDSKLGTVSISSTGATASTLANAESAVLNGTSVSGVLFSFRFATDTHITISANCSDFYTYYSDVYLQIVDGSGSILRDTGEGYSFIAKANHDYGVRIFVREGVVCQNLVFKPQIEIGARSAFEPYAGVSAFYSDPDAVANLFAPNGKLTTEYYADKRVDCVFDHAAKTVYVSAREPSSATICHDPASDKRVNGKTTLYLQKISFEKDTAVTVSGIDPAFAEQVRLQVTDGTTIYADRGDGVTFTALAGREYAIRIYVAQGASFDSLAITPVIATGIHALSTQRGTSTIYASDASVLAIKPAGEIKLPEASTRRPMITFIDDDTTLAEYVQIFHDIFAAKGLTADFAVITQQIEKDPALLPLLLQYASEGFGTLYHCDYQSGDKTNYWMQSYRDMAQAEANFAAGLEKMEQFGFSDYLYWVSPYGVFDPEMQELAKKYGMECLVSYNKNAFITEGNCDRFNIPRYSLSASGDNNLPKIIEAINACCLANGWIIVTTHVNEWGGQVDEMSQTLSDLIDYALDSGMEVVSFAEGYERAQDWFLN